MEKKALSKYDLPQVPGVYLFTKGKGKQKKVLYVGKATSLRDRVRSYFDDDLIATRGPRVVDMVTSADGISYETTPTVLEALVREAALIREYDPPANAMGKDDKSFLYAVITDEIIPRVLMLRGKDINFATKTAGELKLRDMHGPFTSGTQLKEALRLIRKIFPFYDTARPIVPDATGKKGTVQGANKHLQAKVEFNRQIGQYPKDIERKEYLQSIKNVSLFLSGQVKTLRTKLKKDMKSAIADERFEDAGTIKRQLFSLDHIQDVSLIQEEHSRKKDSPRIEAYDVAHLSGTNAIGVMVVVDGSVPVWKEYRSFRIRGNGGKSLNNDIASLKEILVRRFGHPEWNYPRVIVVDGGTTHKKAATEVLRELGIEIPVVAIVKDDKHRPREVLGGKSVTISDADAVLANSEAHRFSIALHRKARNRSLIQKSDKK
ncbi:MAG: hypothetical protein AAB472_01890 [Patescibacteria group bacterium]